MTGTDGRARGLLRYPPVRLASIPFPLLVVAGLTANCEKARDANTQEPDSSCNAAIGCSGGGSARFVFAFSCSSPDLTAVSVSGPCATGDASPGYGEFAEGQFLDVGSSSPGDCHVVLTFGTGFTYSADVTFTSQPQTLIEPCTGGGPMECPPLIEPTQTEFMVDNPCADAGPDATGIEAAVDSGPDAGLDAGADAGIDAGDEG
jgi:hypothetical protein